MVLGRHPAGPNPRQSRESMAASNPHQEVLTAWKRWAKWAAKTRVPVGVLLAAGACVLASPTPDSLMAGVPIAIGGLAIRAWAAGHLRKNQELAVSGPYAHVRNPLYVGSLIAALGLAITAAHPVLVIAIAAVFVLWFLPVVGEEEDHIRKILPGFREYEARVPRFVPSLAPRYPSREEFEWKLYFVNREYSAALGFGVFLFVLWVKLMLS